MPARNIKIRLRKKPLALLVAGVLVLGTGTAALAYWSNTGAGAGAGTLTTPAAALVVNQTSTVTGLGPGTPAQPLSGNFDNNNTSSVYVSKVIVGAITATKNGNPVTGCTTSDFTITNPQMTVNAEVPSGTAKGAWSGATIAFNDSATVNQDACKGVTISIAYTSN